MGWVQSVREMLGNSGECQGNVAVGVNCQGIAGNAEKCEGNVWEWVYCASGMQGTTRGM